jgi:hypothetical protein
MESLSPTTGVYFWPNTSRGKNETKYDVLTLHRESDGVCVIRLRGYGSNVFWKEVKMHPHIIFFKTPRQKILNAQIKAQRLSDKLKRHDDICEQEFNGVNRDV